MGESIDRLRVWKQCRNARRLATFFRNAVSGNAAVQAVPGEARRSAATGGTGTRREAGQPRATGGGAARPEPGNRCRGRHRQNIQDFHHRDGLCRRRWKWHGSRGWKDHLDCRASRRRDHRPGSGRQFRPRDREGVSRRTRFLAGLDRLFFVGFLRRLLISSRKRSTSLARASRRLGPAIHVRPPPRPRGFAPRRVIRPDQVAQDPHRDADDRNYPEVFHCCHPLSESPSRYRYSNSSTGG